MQRNFYVLALTAALSHNASALEIQKGTILESKQWTTGNGSLQVTNAPAEIKNKFSALPSLQSPHKNNRTAIENIVIASTRFYQLPQIAAPDSMVQGFSYTNLDITNTSNQDKTYKVLIKYCVTGSDNHESECVINKYKVILEPGGKLQEVNDIQAITFSTGTSNRYYWAQNSIAIENVEDNSIFYTQDYFTVNVMDLSLELELE